MAKENYSFYSINFLLFFDILKYLREPECCQLQLYKHKKKVLPIFGSNFTSDLSNVENCIHIIYMEGIENTSL